MRVLLLVTLYVVLHCASCESHQETIEPLMNNVVVVLTNNPSGSRRVPLVCGEAYENQTVFWKKNGALLRTVVGSLDIPSQDATYCVRVSQGKERTPRLEGNRVSVWVEEMMGGNYTCHLSADGRYLNHTLVLIQIDTMSFIILERSTDQHRNHEYIHCLAHNYSGSFHCTWKRVGSRSTAAVLLVKADRNSEPITCELDADGSGVQCKDINCPYKEENQRIALTTFIHSHARLEEYTTYFYLRDIVTPERLSNLNHSVQEGVTHWSWDYPDSWEKPCTYFGLQFQVRLVHDGEPCHTEIVMEEITEEPNYNVTTQRKKYTFCVRAKDKYTQGPWSKWQHNHINLS